MARTITKPGQRPVHARSIGTTAEVDVDVECCEHCHGDPDECTDVGARGQEASPLLERAYWALKEGGDASGLLLDMRDFFSGEPLWVTP